MGLRLVAAVLAVVAACGPARAPVPLPVPPPRSLDGVVPRMAIGERTVWNVYLEALQIGRADLAIDEHVARSEFRTSRAAALFAAVRFEVATALDAAGGVRGIREHLAIDGRAEDAEVPVGGAAPAVPGGTRLHSLHTALGAVRAWSATRAAGAPAFLWMWNGGALYRVDLAPVRRDEALGIRALRVDGVVRAPHLEPSIQVSVWLAANADRTPLRFAVSVGGRRFTAEVSESNASLTAR